MTTDNPQPLERPSLARPIMSVRPLVVDTADRLLSLQVKVTAPTTGTSLPVIVFSHGYEWSMDAYEPLAHRWAEAGFIVVQPTHLDSRRHGIALDDDAFPDIWRVRIADLHAIIDSLATIVDQVPTLRPRTNLDQLAVVGHSWGGQTAGALLGARVLDENGLPGENFTHPAVKAGALLSATGAGEDLTAFAIRYLPFARPEFATMTVPTLVVAGGKDQSAMSTRGPDWFEDAYHLSPSATRLLVIDEAEHLLGGIAGEDVNETTDENPARVALVADAVLSHLQDIFGIDEGAWGDFRTRATHSGEPLRIVTKVHTGGFGPA
jgi:pimeloyl-ACP methyl ester carboxylesterase